jgi:prepilin-type N-terminal cleavage/methylation domain-containing protein
MRVTTPFHTPHRRRGSRHAPRGYTLLEIVVALALAAVVVQTGAGVLDQVATHGRHIDHDATSITRTGTGDLLLARLIADATTSTDTTQQFAGDPRAIEFTTRCERPAGFSASCRMTLSIDATADSSAIIARSIDGRLLHLLTLRRQLGSASFVFLHPSRHDSSWTTHWQTAVTLPAAVAVTTPHDTLILPIGVARI